MTHAAAANNLLEKTRQVANLVQEGQFTMAVHHLAQCATQGDEFFSQVCANLESYILKSDLDDLIATVSMVRS